MTLNDTLVPTYLQMLKALSAWLGKAAEQLPTDRAAAIMNARLAPDMFPLFTQVCFTCVQAQEGVSHLRQQSLPASLATLRDEGVNAGSGAQTIADAQALIAEAISIVETASAGIPELASDTAVAHTLPNGMIFDLNAEQYVRDWALPQFYFHLMAAYAILRAEGVNLGKADYSAHMFGLIRPGTMAAPG